MITRSAKSLQTNNINIYQKPVQSWQEVLSQSVTSPQELLEILDLDPALLPGAIAGSQSFQIRVPRTFIARMERGNPNDPLLRQVLPIQAELDEMPGFTLDPLGEQPKNSHRGIIHKYHGRLLLMPGQLCAVNCRFCFRRHFPYEDNTLNKEEWQSALEYIRQDTSLKEIILSGGDPLAQNDQRLAWIIEQLAKIPHLQRLRIHTRLPIMIPQRVTDTLLKWLTGTRLQPIVVLHSNHPHEIDDHVTDVTKRLHQHGVQLLNQSTLLRGINDNADALIELSEKLFSSHVMPYYLHLFDKVQGAAHFDVDEDHARAIMGEMARRSSGYLVPKLAREMAGMPCKITVPPIIPDAPACSG